MMSINGLTLMNYLLKTSITSLANGHVTFMEDGDVSGRYSIRYLGFLENKYEFFEVGKWNKETTSSTVIQSHVQVPWYVLSEKNLSSTTPISVCSKPCKMRERQIPHPNNNPCCWVCEECDEDEIVMDQKCQSCIDRSNNIFGWPNKNHSACIPILPNRNKWQVPIIFIDSIGILLTIITFGLYLKSWENSLVKASSRKVSFLIFIGK